MIIEIFCGCARNQSLQILVRHEIQADDKIVSIYRFDSMYIEIIDSTVTRLSESYSDDSKVYHHIPADILAQEWHVTAIKDVTIINSIQCISILTYQVLVTNNMSLHVQHIM